MVRKKVCKNVVNLRNIIALHSWKLEDLINYASIFLPIIQPTSFTVRNELAILVLLWPSHACSLSLLIPSLGRINNTGSIQHDGVSSHSLKYRFLFRPLNELLSFCVWVVSLCELLEADEAFVLSLLVAGAVVGLSITLAVLPRCVLIRTVILGFQQKCGGASLQRSYFCWLYECIILSLVLLQRC